MPTLTVGTGFRRYGIGGRVKILNVQFYAGNSMRTLVP